GSLPRSSGGAFEAPLPTDNGTGAGGPADSGVPGDSAAPDQSQPPQPPLLAVREVYALQADGAAVDLSGTTLPAKRTASGTEITIAVRYHDRGPGPVEVDPTAWSLITSDGEDVGLLPPSTGGLDAGSLTSGQTRTGELRGKVKSTPDQTFVAFTD